MSKHVRPLTSVLALVCSLGLGVFPGCGAFERWACGEPCRAENSPAQGTQADFTLAEQPDLGASVSAPFVCDTVGEFETFAATVETHGTDVEIDRDMWIVDRLIPALEARQLYVGQQFADCGPSGDRIPALVSADWALLDAITRTIIETAEEDDVAVEVLLVVEPRLGACPDEACGV